jgi:hypothetical protein
LEHPAATSLLPLAWISKLFVVNDMPNTLVGNIDVNINKLIKLMGNFALPRKPSHPRGLLRGESPPKKRPHFSQKFASTPTTPQHLNLRQIQAEHNRPSGKDARAGDSPRLQQDTTFLSCLWTSGSLVKSKLSTPDLPKSRKRVPEQHGKRNKDGVLFTKYFKLIVVHYTATRPEC